MGNLRSFLKPAQRAVFSGLYFAVFRPARTFSVLLLAVAFPLLAKATQDSPSIERGPPISEADATLEKDPLTKAADVYAKAFQNRKSGLYFEGELAFVVVVLEKASALETEQIEKKCLLETLKILREADGVPAGQEGLVPLSNALLEQFPFLKAECRKVDPSFATRRLALNKIDSRVIENQFQESSFRQCTALRASDLRQALSVAPPPTVSETVRALRKRLESLEDEPDALAEFWGRLGAVDEVLNLANEESWLEWPMNSYGEIKGDSLDAIRMIRGIEKGNAEPRSSLAEPRRFLQSLPGLPEGFAELANRSIAAEDYAKGLNFLMLSRIEGDQFIQPERLIAEWRAKCSVDNPRLSEGLSEFVELFRKIKPTGLGLGRVVHPAVSILNRSWNTLGNVNPPQNLTQAKQAASSKTNEDKEAQNWPDHPTLDRFYEAVGKNPRSPAGWQDLGRQAKQAGQLELAIVCLRQAVRLEPADSQSRMLLAECYQKIGLQRLFLSTALAAALKSPEPDDEGEPALQLLTSAFPPAVRK